MTETIVLKISICLGFRISCFGLGLGNLLNSLLGLLQYRPAVFNQRHCPFILLQTVFQWYLSLLYLVNDSGQLFYGRLEAQLIYTVILFGAHILYSHNFLFLFIPPEQPFCNCYLLIINQPQSLGLLPLGILWITKRAQMSQRK